MIERKRADVCGVFEHVEGGADLTALEAGAVHADMVDVLAHAADAIKEDLKVAEAIEAEMVRAVQNWSGLAENLLVCAKKSGEERPRVNPFLGFGIVALTTDDWTSRLIDSLRSRDLESTVT